MINKIPDYFIECHTARLARIKEMEDIYKHDPCQCQAYYDALCTHRITKGASTAIHGIMMGDDASS